MKATLFAYCFFGCNILHELQVQKNVRWQSEPKIYTGPLLVDPYHQSWARLDAMGFFANFPQIICGACFRKMLTRIALSPLWAPKPPLLVPGRMGSRATMGARLRRLAMPDIVRALHAHAQQCIKLRRPSFAYGLVL